MKKTIFLLLLILLFLQGYSQSLPKVKMLTSFGNIIIEIDTIKAQVTAKNFLKNINEGIYEKALFYRVVRMDNQPDNKVKIEVVQGGIYSDAEIEKVKPIRHEPTNETRIKHLNGTISMARMEPGTASTEFFICVGDQPELDFGGKRNPDGQGFAAFGRVIGGMDEVRKIQHLKEEGQILVEKVVIKDIKEIPAGN